MKTSGRLVFIAFGVRNAHVNSLYKVIPFRYAIFQIALLAVCRKFAPIGGADQLDSVLARRRRQGDRAARLDPLPRHVEIGQPGQGFGHAQNHHRQRLAGQQPAGRGPHPVAGVALVAHRRGLIDKLDIRPNAGLPCLKVCDNDVGDLALLAVIDATAVYALPVGVVGAHNQLDHRLAGRRQRGIKAVMFDAQLAALFARQQDRLVQQQRHPMGFGREIAVDPQRNLAHLVRGQMPVVHAADFAVGELAAEHIEDSPAPVGGRDDPVGAVDFIIVKAHAHGAPIFGQNLFHLRFIIDLPAQLEIAFFHGARKLQRGAHRKAGVADVHVGQQHHAHHHGRFIPGEHLRRRFLQEGIVKRRGKVTRGEPRPLCQRGHVGQHFKAQLQPLPQPHQRLGNGVHGGHIKTRELAHPVAQSADAPGVFGAEVGHVRLQAVGIGIDNQSFLAVGDALVFLVVDKCAPLHGAQLAPHGVEGLPLAGAEEVVDAAVEDVAFTLPGGAQPARQVVHFKNPALVAVHLGVAARRKTGDAGANDDDRFIFRHFSSTFLAKQMQRRSRSLARRFLGTPL